MWVWCQIVYSCHFSWQKFFCRFFAFFTLYDKKMKILLKILCEWKISRIFVTLLEDVLDDISGRRILER